MTPRPLVVVTLAFMAGILAAAYALPLALFGLLTLVLLLVLLGITRRPRWAVAALIAAFGLLGSARYLAASFIAPNDISHLVPSFVTLTGIIASEPQMPEGAQGALPARAGFALTVRRAASAQGIEETATPPLPVTGTVQVRVPLEDQIRGDSSQPVDSARKLPQYGDVVTVRGRLEAPSGPRNPGAFDYRAYLARRGIFALLTVRRSGDWEIVSQGHVTANPLLYPASRLRQGLLSHAAKTLPAERAGVLNGILLGAREDLPLALQDDFERTGTTHLLATAGLHVGMVVGLLIGLLSLFRFAHRPRLLLTLLALALYAAMAGGRPSVVRAALMASVFLGGFLLEREPDLFNSLALAALLLLLGNPHDLFDAGFQLSFATVLTIILLMPFAEEKLQRLRAGRHEGTSGKRALYGGLTVVVTCFFLAIAAQVGVWPLVAYYFNDVSLVSVIANTLVVPAIPVVIALGFLAAAIGFVLPVLAWPLDGLLNLLLAYVIGVIRGCAALPYAGFHVVSPPVLLIAAYYVLLWGLSWYGLRNIRLKREESA